MKETLKEKRIRFVLIGFFILITIFGFVSRLEVRETEEKHYTPLAFVLKSSEDLNDNPMIALYEYKNSKHILAVYEIDRTNKYKFNTIHAVELKEGAEQISSDMTEKGIWVKVNHNWKYYSQSLQEENRPLEHRKSSSVTPYSFDKKRSILTINTNHTIHLEKGEKPTGLYSLSYDGSVWLVLTERNIKIAAIDTK